MSGILPPERKYLWEVSKIYDLNSLYANDPVSLAQPQCLNERSAKLSPDVRPDQDKFNRAASSSDVSMHSIKELLSLNGDADAQDENRININVSKEQFEVIVLGLQKMAVWDDLWCSYDFEVDWAIRTVEWLQAVLDSGAQQAHSLLQKARHQAQQIETAHGQIDLLAQAIIREREEFEIKASELGCAAKEADALARAAEGRARAAEARLAQREAELRRALREKQDEADLLKQVASDLASK